MSKPTLVLFCGLPGSGKTTLAKKLASEYGAVRLNTDEWMADLGFDPNDENLHNKMQARLWKLAQEVLRAGQDVVLENGLWTRLERDDKRRDAAQLGVHTELHYLNVPMTELVRRLQARNAASEHGHAHVTEEEIKRYAQIFEAPSDQELSLFSRVVVH